MATALGTTDAFVVDEGAAAAADSVVAADTEVGTVVPPVTPLVGVASLDVPPQPASRGANARMDKSLIFACLNLKPRSYIRDAPADRTPPDQQ